MSETAKDFLASWTLNGDITDSDLTISLAGSTAPVATCDVRIDNELLTITGVTGAGTPWSCTVTRAGGTPATAAAAHSSSAVARQVLTNRQLQALISEIAGALVDDLSGVSNTSTARTNLGLAIGSDVQAYSAVLAALVSVMSSTATAAAQRTALGLEIGTDVAAQADARFTGIAANQQSDSYTLALTDAGKMVEMGKGTSQTLTIPANGTAAFPVGTVITVVQTGAGQVTVAITSDTLNAPNGAKTAKQWSVLSLYKQAATVWVLSGDSAT